MLMIGKLMTPSGLILALLGAVAFSGNRAHANNLVVNGSFEQGGFVNSGDGFMNLPVGSTAITGWTVINNDIAWGYTVNSYGLTPSDGSYFLDLTGYHYQGQNAGLEQTIATTASQQYSLSFDLGVKQGDPNFHGPFDVTATAGSTSTTITYNPPGTGNIWTTYNLDFTASSTSTLISFTGNGGFYYIGLDNVSVDAVSTVPEPSALTLAVISGLLLAASVRWSQYGRKAA